MKTITLNIAVTLTECSSSKEIKMNNDFNVNVPMEVKRELFKMGFHSGTNNDCIKKPLSDKQIKKAAELLAPYYGMITKYYTWYINGIKSHRIIFGN